LKAHDDILKKEVALKIVTDWATFVISTFSTFLTKK
jgi:hypothetical protein